MRFESIPLGSGFGVRLNISDLNIPKNEKEALEPYLSFSVNTYKVLSAEGDDPARFREVEGAANWTLTCLWSDDSVAESVLILVLVECE